MFHTILLPFEIFRILTGIKQLDYKSSQLLKADEYNEPARRKKHHLPTGSGPTSTCMEVARPHVGELAGFCRSLNYHCTPTYEFISQTQAEIRLAFEADATNAVGAGHGSRERLNKGLRPQVQFHLCTKHLLFIYLHNAWLISAFKKGVMPTYKQELISNLLQSQMVSAKTA